MKVQANSSKKTSYAKSTSQMNRPSALYQALMILFFFIHSFIHSYFLIPFLFSSAPTLLLTSEHADTFLSPDRRRTSLTHDSTKLCTHFLPFSCILTVTLLCAVHIVVLCILCALRLFHLESPFIVRKTLSIALQWSS